jgi:hypothetical protein
MGAPAHRHKQTIAICDAEEMIFVPDSLISLPIAGRSGRPIVAYPTNRPLPINPVTPFIVPIGAGPRLPIMEVR